MRTCTAILVLVVGCGSQEPPRSAVPIAPPRPAASLGPRPEAPDAAPSDAFVEASPAEPEDPFAGTIFPPPDFAPPHERSAKKGDGIWQRLGDASSGERAAAEPAVLYRTNVQPHNISKWISVTVAAIDLRHASLHLSAGSDDPGVAALPASQPPGLVPEEHRGGLFAVFNGGFKPQHGNWGMMVAGRVLVPPREDGCTVVLNPGDTVVVGSWPSVRERAERARSYRQTPPCLVENGEVNPSLLAGEDRVWAGRDPKLKTRRRSAIGVDRTGRILLFGVGMEAEPRLLAEGMKYAGAVNAAQLDINWNWTRFLLFGEKDGTLQITSTLIPEMVHQKRGYVERTQPRDFFYLVRKPAVQSGAD